MTKEICIKTRSGMQCSASPIADCSCAQDPAFRDPYPDIGDDPGQADGSDLRDAEFSRLSPKDKLTRRLKRVIDSTSVGNGAAEAKGKDIVRIVKLLLLAKADLRDSYVITALVDLPSEEVQERGGAASAG